MFVIRPVFVFALTIGCLANSACSDSTSDQTGQDQGGSGGTSLSGQSGAGARNDGDDAAGGRKTTQPGAATADGGADADAPSGSDVGEDEARGGDQNAAGGRDSDGGAGKGRGGSGNGRGGAANGSGGHGGASAGHGGASGGSFVIGDPSAECEAAAPVNEGPTSVLPGLALPATTGHGCDDSFEPNDAAGTACRLTLGAEVGTQLSAPSDDTDNYVFHAEAGVAYEMQLSALDCLGGNSSFGVTAKSLAAAGQTTQVDGRLYYGHQQAYTIQSNTTADELITISSNDPCQYKLSVFESTAQGLKHDAQYEPNDTPGTAPVIALGQLVSSSLSSPSDTVDYFTLRVQANLTYTVHVTAEHCTSSSSSLFTLRGSSLGSGAPVDNLGAIYVYGGVVYDAEFSTTSSGDELLAFSAGQSCDYQFYVIPSTVCGLGHGDNYEPNQTAATAAPIPLEQSIRDEVRQPADEVDYYTFEVEPNSKYSLSLSATNCIGSNSVAADLWSGRTDSLLNGSTHFYFGSAKTAYTFTTGSSTQELLRLQSSQSCAYEFSLSKG